MGAPRRPVVRVATLCLVLAVSSCFPVPPPLTYAANPVPPGHTSVGFAMAGSVDPGSLSPVANVGGVMPLPGVQLSLRHGLGHGASIGGSVTLGGVLMLDGRLEAFHARYLSLSLGAELGAGGFFVPHPVACTAGGCSGFPPLFVLAGVPVVFGVPAGPDTLLVGLRPGLRLAPGAGAYSVDPLAGGLLGLSIPVGGHSAIGLQVDVAHSFNAPDTVFTFAVGASL